MIPGATPLVYPHVTLSAAKGTRCVCVAPGFTKPPFARLKGDQALHFPAFTRPLIAVEFTPFSLISA